MRYVKPHYYDKFQCIADKCPDTCCAGWQIVIDDNTLEKYRKYVLEENGTEFAAYVAKSVDWEEGCFCQSDRRCAMLDENNLCKLISEKGEEYLCDTCNRYPRHIEEFDGVREYSLSLSCPQAANIMLKMKEQTVFLEEEDECPDPLEEEFEDFDFMLFTQLEDAREIIFKIINDRQKPLLKRMAMLVDMALKMQACIDEDRLYDMQNVVREFDVEANGCTGSWVELLTGEERFCKLKECFKIYTKLERLNEEWTKVLDGAWNTLYAGDYSRYEKLYEEFYGSFVKQPDWDIFLEQILTFFIYTYFCGAVYDDCIYSKVLMSVMAACYIQEFCMYTWIAGNKKLSQDECIVIAYRYAREIEHSDLNLNDLEQWLMDRM